MTTAIKKEKIATRSSDKHLKLSINNEGSKVTRLKNIFNDMLDVASSSEVVLKNNNLSQTDDEYAIDAIIELIRHKYENSPSKEKQRLLRRAKSKSMFLARLNQDGGYLSSAETAESLGITKTTVRNWKEQGNLFAIKLDNEFVYPIFQFTDEEHISNKGVLKGLPELLKLINTFSDRMQYSFFMEKRHVVLNGFKPTKKSYTVIDVLKTNPNSEVMEELYRLARLHGSQDPA